jgi:replicative DNA helicase
MGKTALELTMACGFAKQGKVGIVFNNEERVERLRMRGLCCATGMTAKEVRADPDRAKALAREVGFHNIIFISLSPGSPQQIEAFVDRYKAKWFIVDQLRNLNVKSDTKTNQLEEGAKSMRNIAKKFDAVAITITQAGDSAEGKAVLTMGDVDSSNTGIPGACDVLLGIGATEEQKRTGIRVLSLSKNKIGGVHDDFPVRFNPWLSRYVSIKD